MSGKKDVSNRVYYMVEKKLIVPHAIYHAPLVRVKRNVITIRAVGTSSQETTEVPLLLSDTSAAEGFYRDVRHTVDIVKEIIVEGHAMVCVRLGMRGWAAQMVLEKFFAINSVKTGIFSEIDREYHVFTVLDKKRFRELSERHCSATSCRDG